MTMKRVSSVMAVLGAGVMLAACSMEQPSAGCVVQDSASWIAKYELKTGQPTCAKAAPTGELVGVFKFVNPEDDTAKLTFRPDGLASRGARDSGESTLQTAIGNLSAEADAEDFCAVPQMSEAKVNAASEPNVEDATQISYKFANVKVYSHPRAPGTQFKADLTYTRDGCIAEYTVNAMWPARGCDPASADTSLNCGAGSLINPDFDVVCDTTVKISSKLPGTCVLKKSVPSFKE
jgi:hypothetical protein